jgi:hypothetical protein
MKSTFGGEADVQERDVSARLPQVVFVHDDPVAQTAGAADSQQNDEEDHLNMVELLLDLAHFMMNLTAYPIQYPWFCSILVS